MGITTNTHEGLKNTIGDLNIINNASDKDIIFKGNDGGSTITALTLDVSENGKAIFNGLVAPANNLQITNNTPTLTLGVLNTSTGNSKIQFFSKNSSSNGYAIQYNKNGSGAGEDQLEFIDGGGTATVAIKNGGDFIIPGYIEHYGDSNTKFGFSGADTFLVHVGGGDRLKVETSGTVLLSDGGNADGAVLYLRHANNNSTDTISSIFFGNNADATLSAIVTETNGANNTSNLKFRTSNAGTIGTALTLNANNSATFQGDVEIRTGKKLILQRPNNGVATEISTDSTGAMVLNSINEEGFFFNNNGTNIFKLDPVNATFAGNVDFSSNKGLTWAGSHSVRVESNILKMAASGGIQLQNDATFSGDIGIPVAKKIYFGGGSHTYITEDADDRLRFFVGGAEFMRFTEDTSDTINFYQDASFSGKLCAGDSFTDKAVVYGHLGIGSNTYPKVAYPGYNAQWSASGSSTGQIVIDLPGTLANYDMTYMEIDIYEYSASNATKLIIGGHNWNSGGNGNTSSTMWHNRGVTILGYFDKSIYFGWRNDGTNNRRCIAIGEVNSSWSYGTVHVAKVSGAANFYSSAIDWLGDWEVTQTTSTSFFNASPGTNHNTSATHTLRTPGIVSPVGGISFDGNTISGIDDSSEFTNDDAHIMTSAAIEDKILSYGYGTGSGSGSGDVTLAGTQTFTGAKTFKNSGGIIIERSGNTDASSINMEGNFTFVSAAGYDHRFVDGSTEIGRFANSSGDWVIRHIIEDKDILFCGNDGAGNNNNHNITALQLDMSDAGTAIFNHDVSVKDGGQLRAGNGGDLYLLHDATNSYLQNETGDLYIQNGANGKDVILRSDDGSNGQTAYITLDGSDTIVRVHKPLYITEYITHIGDDNTRFGFSAADTFVVHAGATGHAELTITSTTATFAGAVSLTGGSLSISGDGSNAVTFTETSAGIMTIAAPDDIILDAASDIILDAGGDDIRLKVGGTEFGKFNNASSNMNIFSSIQDKDIVFTGNDGGSAINALILDMSAGGQAAFSSDVFLPSGGALFLDGGNNTYIQESAADQLIFVTGGTTRLTIDSSGNATFAGALTTAGGIAHTGDTDTLLEFTGANELKIKAGGATHLHCGSDQTTHIYSGNGVAISCDTSQNSTFGGNIQANGTITVGANDTGHDVFFYGATSGKYLKWDESADCLFFPDDTSIKFGNGNDARIYVSSDNLLIQQDTADKDIKFLADNGSGQATEYFRLDGGGTLTFFSKPLQMADSQKIFVGDAGDLQVQHDATDSLVDNYTGNLYIRQQADDKDIIFQADNGSGGVTPYITLDGSAGYTTVQKQMRFDDSIKAQFGASGDLSIRHDTTNSEIVNLTGDLNITCSGDDVKIQAADDVTIFVQGGETGARFGGNGGVDLYHNNVKKFSTSAAGTQTKFSATSNTDGDAAGDIVYFSETSTTAGRIYYYTSGGGWELTDADAVSTSTGMLAVALGENSSTGGMLIRGMVTLNHDPGTRGDTLFLANAAGSASSTAPSGSGDIVRVIGYCLDSTNGQVYFNPDGAFVEVA